MNYEFKLNYDDIEEDFTRDCDDEITKMIEAMKAKPVKIQEQAKESNISSDTAVGNNNAVSILDDDILGTRSQIEDNTSIDATEDIFNLALPLEKRMMLFNNHYAEDPDDILTIVNKLNSMLMMSNINLISAYIGEISINSILPLRMKLQCADILCSNPKSISVGFKNLDILLEECVFSVGGGDVGVSSVVIFDKIIQLTNNSLEENACRYLTKFLNNPKINIEYRYKSLLSLRHLITTDDIKKQEFIENLVLKFIKTQENNIRYRILACQYILSPSSPSSQKTDACEVVEQILLGFLLDKSQDINTRADTADVIILSSRVREEYKSQAREILVELGGGKNKTLYDNSQNVHTEIIEKSVFKILEAIMSEVGSTQDSETDVDDNFLEISRKILDFIESDECKYSIGDAEKIQKTCHRIDIDRSIFILNNPEYDEKTEMTLKFALVAVWTYIEMNEYANAMKTRLLEELIDANDTCASGYLLRIVNSVSGFGVYNLTIDVADQFIASFKARFNKKIQESLKSGDVLDDMTTGNDLLLKDVYRECFLENIELLRQEMYEEFNEYMTDADFDLYFRKALIIYEGY